MSPADRSSRSKARSLGIAGLALTAIGSIVIALCVLPNQGPHIYDPTRPSPELVVHGMVYLVAPLVMVIGVVAVIISLGILGVRAKRR